MIFIIRFDPLATPQQVTDVMRGRDTADFGTQIAGVFVPDNDIVINADLSALDGIVPRKYWKHEAGAIVEYTQVEKDAQEAAEDAARTQGVRDAVKGLFDGFGDSQLQTRVILSIIIDEFNILRTREGLAPRTMAQLRNAYRNRTDDGTVDS